MAERLYMIQVGETLKSIARDRLGGEENRWQEIAYINSLNHPYIVSPGQLILLPSLSSPLEIVVTKGTEGTTGVPDKGGAPTATDFKLSPAELGLMIGGAALLWYFLSR